MNDAFEMAQKASEANDRTLFIWAIVGLCLFVFALLIYIVRRVERMSDKAHDVGERVAVVVSRNTVALDNNSAVVVDNSKVITDCQTEIIKCRQANERRG